jgi:hypothetical protein
MRRSSRERPFKAPRPETKKDAARDSDEDDVPIAQTLHQPQDKNNVKVCRERARSAATTPCRVAP